MNQDHGRRDDSRPGAAKIMAGVRELAQSMKPAPAAAVSRGEIEIVERNPRRTVYEVEAWLQGRRIAYAISGLRRHRTELEQLRVDDGVSDRWPWRTYEGLPQNFQRRGVGGRLLQLIIAKAQADGAKEVWGFIVDQDLKASPFLPEWYKRHGFELLEPDAECLHNAVIKIRRKL